MELYRVALRIYYRTPDGVEVTENVTTHDLELTKLPQAVRTMATIATEHIEGKCKVPRDPAFWEPELIDLPADEINRRYSR